MESNTNRQFAVWLTEQGGWLPQNGDAIVNLAEMDVVAASQVTILTYDNDEHRRPAVMEIATESFKPLIRRSYSGHIK